MVSFVFFFRLLGGSLMDKFILCAISLKNVATIFDNSAMNFCLSFLDVEWVTSASVRKSFTCRFSVFWRVVMLLCFCRRFFILFMRSFLIFSNQTHLPLNMWSVFRGSKQSHSECCLVLLLVSIFGLKQECWDLTLFIMDAFV